MHYFDDAFLGSDDVGRSWLWKGTVTSIATVHHWYIPMYFVYDNKLLFRYILYDIVLWL